DPHQAVTDLMILDLRSEARYRGNMKQLIIKIILIIKYQSLSRMYVFIKVWLQVSGFPGV
nr:hypothetical protein [Desulfobacteraceae bacterium]